MEGEREEKGKGTKRKLQIVITAMMKIKQGIIIDEGEGCMFDFFGLRDL